MTTEERLNHFLAMLELTPDTVRTIKSMVEKIRYEAYDEGRRAESIPHDHL